MDKVLLYLLKKNDFVSGEEISKKLSISRTAVWKHIKMARERGFEIVSVKGKGYKIRKNPEDRIIPEIVFNLFPELPCEFLYFNELDSTNDYAKRNINKLKNCDYLIITDNQTKGRGRFERVWQSCKGKDLTFSMVIHPFTEIRNFYSFTIITSLAIYMSVSALLTGKEINNLKIKWPNDIYYFDKKLCGILSEMLSEEAILQSLIIGVGINVNSLPELENAISLYKITNKIIDRNCLLSSFLKNFYLLYETYKDKKGWEKIFNEWKKNLKNLGEIVNFKLNDKTVNGKFVDVNTDGSVIIESEGGKLYFYAGEFL